MPFEIIKWILAIAVGAALGSIIATEITFWQMKHRSMGVLDHLISAVFKRKEIKSIKQTLDHLKNFMEALDEFGKSEEMEKLARDLGKMYRELPERLGTLFGYALKPPEKKRVEKVYG